MTRPDWDRQFAETEYERSERQAKARRLVYDKAKRTIVQVDPRDPDYSRTGIFINHNCWKCDSGKKPCPHGGAHNCEHPHARND